MAEAGDVRLALGSEARLSREGLEVVAAQPRQAGEQEEAAGVPADVKSRLDCLEAPT